MLHATASRCMPPHRVLILSIASIVLKMKRTGTPRLEKLGKDPLRKFFWEYLPNFDLRDSTNQERTWLPKVAD